MGVPSWVTRMLSPLLIGPEPLRCRKVSVSLIEFSLFSIGDSASEVPKGISRI